VVLNSNGTASVNEAWLKDHLGNIRATYYLQAGSLKTQQVDSYYPFGMNIKGLTADGSATYKPNEYLYNGKMMQDEMGLNWLDYGARMYDAVLGRWHVSDVFAEQAYSLSPYRYGLNNPVSFVDPDGNLESTHTDEDGNIVDVKNDGDNGVYKHKGKGEEAKKEVDKNYSKKNTGAGGDKMGETDRWDEFMNHNSSGDVTYPQYGAKINFNVSVDKYIDGLNQTVENKIKNDGLINAAVWTKNQSDGKGNDGNTFDVKKVLGSSNGYLYGGKYYSGESIGNILAGKNAATLKPITHNAGEWWIVTIEMAGRLHMKQNHLNIEPNGGKWHGENEYAGKMILKGYYSVVLKNGWIF
jgi:RHS repeat-associated protein